MPCKTKKRGWFGEPGRHALAAMGIRTKKTAPRMSMPVRTIRYRRPRKGDEVDYGCGCVVEYNGDEWVVSMYCEDHDPTVGGEDYDCGCEIVDSKVEMFCQEHDPTIPEEFK